jgi:hypothetical protein
MRMTTTVAGVGAVAVAVGVTLTGCGSGEKSDRRTTESNTTTQSSQTVTSTKAAPTTPNGTGAHRTIQDYIKENNIQETTISRGDPGPTIDLPVPDGWEVVTDLPSAPYGAIVYQGSSAPDNPPRILAILEKLTGNVDPEEILALAPGELKNTPGYDGPTEGKSTSLSGYQAVQLGGHYKSNGKEGMVAQKTVVIPGPDGLYVLQLNAYSDVSEADILSSATDMVDEETTITF